MTTPATTDDLQALSDAHSAHNYHPLPVVISAAEGAWVTDVEGRRYLDMLAAYSAINFGHRHPRLVAAAQRQLDRVTLVSRAFDHDQFGPFCAELAELAGMDMVLPMNTGAEAVETAIKTARKWGYEVKGVPDGRGRHHRLRGQLPRPHHHDRQLLHRPRRARLLRPLHPRLPRRPLRRRGRAGRGHGRARGRRADRADPGRGRGHRPAARLPGQVRELCTARGALMIADEIQSGLGRTGTTFACEHDGVVPDMYLLGKALGGGIVPLSAVVSSREVLGVFKPGQHGSTFGGNPLACAVGREVISMLETGEYQERSAKLGTHMHHRLAALPVDAVREVRGRGLWAGVEFASMSGRQVSEHLAGRGVLVKDTHGTTIRLAPPLTISEEDLDWALDLLEGMLRNP